MDLERGLVNVAHMQVVELQHHFGILYTALSRMRGDYGSIAVWVHEDDNGALPPV